MRCLVLDPYEGVASDGSITTGVGREHVPERYEPLLAEVVAAVTEAADGAAIYLYGSVATGQARRGQSDVDLLVTGLDPAAKAEISTALSARYRDLCRGVELGLGRRDDFQGESDEAYGNRAFLRHYCVHLAGPHLTERLPAFPADARVARGFNGDIYRHAVAWRQAFDRGEMHPAELGRLVARKTLFAAASLVSIHDHTWTTDRERGGRRWSEIEPDLSPDLSILRRWSDRQATPERDIVKAMLDGPVQLITAAFKTRIGLWA